MTRKFLCFLLIILCVSFALANEMSVAFYYGPGIPLDKLAGADIVVVQPNVVKSPRQFSQYDTEFAAYMSIGEVSPSVNYYSKISKDWIIGKVDGWKTEILDQTNPQWHEYFIAKIFNPLWKRGYRTFFLDTVDAYTLVTSDQEELSQQRLGLESLIAEMKAIHPEAKFILNRGFDLLPNIHNFIFAVTAESLFQTWEGKDKQYAEVSEETSKALLKKLRFVEEEYNMPIIVIDYVNPKHALLGMKTAKKIRDLGFIPWVSDVHLTQVGHSSATVIPRKVAVLYDLATAPNLSETSPARFISMPLENLGYEPVFFDVSKSLPENLSSLEYAGVVMWLSSDSVGQVHTLRTWLLDQINRGIHVAILDHFGFSNLSSSLKAFGFTTKSKKKKSFYA